MPDIWILGGTGRVGRGVAALLAARGDRPVLVGRDAGRLADAARATGARTYVAATPDAVTAGGRTRSGPAGRW